MIKQQRAFLSKKLIFEKQIYVVGLETMLRIAVVDSRQPIKAN